MVSYGGLYPAFVVDSSGNPARVRVPQVWQDVTVPLHGIAAVPAVAGQTGWVAFVNGQAEYPVWLGANQPVVIGGGGGGPSVPGLSAYQLAVQAGFEGDLNAWLASLVGPAGATPTVASNAEVTAGTDDAKVVTPLKLFSATNLPHIVRTGPASAITIPQSVVTDIFTMPLPALAAGNLVRFDFLGDFFTSTNNTNLYLKIKLGSTTMVDGTTGGTIAVSHAAGVTAPIRVRGMLYITTTTSERLTMEGEIYSSVYRGMAGTAAENVTTSKNLIVQLVSSSTGGTFTLTPLAGIIEVFK